MHLRYRLSIVIVATLLPCHPRADAADTDGDAIVVRSRRGGTERYTVRRDVDRRDAVERFAVLLPGGPLIVEATLTIDGEPFRMRREALIDAMLKGAETDGNGDVTWEQALQTPAFTFGSSLRQREQEQLIRMLDGDRDGMVDRPEARGFLAAEFGGPAFLVLSGTADGRALLTANGQSDVRALLDTDADGNLSESEVTAAPGLLAGLDTDGNDLLYPEEIGGGDNNYRSRRELYAASQHAVPLGPTSGFDLFIMLRDKYETEGGVISPGSFWRAPDLFDRLDADQDRILAPEEAARLNHVEPDVRLAVDLGSNGDPSRLAVTYVDGGRLRADEGTDGATIDQTGAVVTFSIGAAPPAPDDSARAQFVLDQFDADGNGYLVEAEMAAGSEKQFTAWDADGDGKVFKREIVDAFARERVPQATAIQARVSRAGDPLLDTLDLSGDSRLGLREMRAAAEQLAALDTDGDDRVAAHEIPVSYVVQFRIGNDRSERGRRRRVPEPPADWPRWFVRMDRNRDGDVTVKEFLGDREAFESLDTNGDGFIEPAEAKVLSQPEDDRN